MHLDFCRYRSNLCREAANLCRGSWPSGLGRWIWKLCMFVVQIPHPTAIWISSVLDSLDSSTAFVNSQLVSLHPAGILSSLCRFYLQLLILSVTQFKINQNQNQKETTQIHSPIHSNFSYARYAEKLFPQIYSRHLNGDARLVPIRMGTNMAAGK